MSTTPTILISSRRHERLRQYLRDLWEYRELLSIFVWRDIKVRYKQTVLGAAWAVIQPFFTMIVFSIFFGTLGGMSAKIPGDIPYPIYTYCALLPWQLFSKAMSDASNSLVNNRGLITKVYFPRLTIPLSAILAGLVDFAIAFAVLLAMMLWYGVYPLTSALWSLPFFVLLAMFTAFAIGLWLSALNVEYRDIRYTIPFLTQFWMFASPIAYPSAIVPEKWQALYALNPMVGVIEGFRWALLGNGQSPGLMLIVSTIVVAFLILTGLWYFRKMERTFADIV
jgi:lipopolysaccharide transport system permease protein